MSRRHRHSGGATPEEIRQADLSHLRLQEMTPSQRAELRRRYDDFIKHFGRNGAAPAAAEKKVGVKKWTPGAKR